MRIVATIEARMGSSRLPGKVMLDVMGRPILYYLIERLKKCKFVDAIVLATTVNKEDDELVEFSRSCGITCYRGDENDVLSRVAGAAKSVKADVIVEITADCPLIDYKIIDQMVNIYLNNEVDYVSNVIVRSYPDGMDVQVFSLETLEKSGRMTDCELDREHVSLHIRNNPGIFSRINVLPTVDEYWPDLGLTLDEKEDFSLIKTVLEYFEESPIDITCKEIVEYLRVNNSLIVNDRVKRKGAS